MGIPWGALARFATKLPAVVTGTMAIVEHVQASGADKKAAVLRAVPESLALAEFTVEKDLLNDQAVRDALSAAIDAQHAAHKAWTALQQILQTAGPPGAIAGGAGNPGTPTP